MDEHDSVGLSRESVNNGGNSEEMQEQSQITLLEDRIQQLIRCEAENSDKQSLENALRLVQQKSEEVEELSSQLSDLHHKVGLKETDLAKSEAEREKLEREASDELRGLEAKYNILKRKIGGEPEPKDNNLLRERYEELQKENRYLREVATPLSGECSASTEETENVSPEEKSVAQLREQRTQFLRELHELRQENDELKAELAEESQEGARDDAISRKYSELLLQYAGIERRLEDILNENEDLKARVESNAITEREIKEITLSPNMRRQSASSLSSPKETNFANKELTLKIAELKTITDEQKGRIDQILKDKNSLFSRNQQLLCENEALKTEIHGMRSRAERFQRVFMNYEKMKQNSGDIRKQLLQLRRFPVDLQLTEQIDQAIGAMQSFLGQTYQRIQTSKQENEAQKSQIGYLQGEIRVLEEQRLAERGAACTRQECEKPFYDVFSQFIDIQENEDLVAELKDFLLAQRELVENGFERYDGEISALLGQSEELERRIAACVNGLDEQHRTGEAAFLVENKELCVRLSAANLYRQELEQKLADLQANYAVVATQLQAVEAPEKAAERRPLKPTKPIEMRPENGCIDEIKAENVALLGEIANLGQKAVYLEKEANSLLAVVAVANEYIEYMYCFMTASEAKISSFLRDCLQEAANLAEELHSEQRDSETLQSSLNRMMGAVADLKTLQERQFNAGQILFKEEAEFTARSDDKKLETITKLDNELLEANKQIAELEKVSTERLAEAQSVIRKREDALQQLTLQLDEKTSLITSLLYKIQQLENGHEEAISALQEAQLREKTTVDKMKELEFDTCEKLTEARGKTGELQTRLDEAMAELEEARRQLEQERERTSSAQEAKNAEVRQLFDQIEELNSLLSSEQRVELSLKEQLEVADRQKLELIERCSSATHREQAATEELSTIKEANETLESQINERKATRSDRIQHLTQQLSDLEHKLEEEQENNSILEQDAKQQILLFEQQTSITEADLRRQLEESETIRENLSCKIEELNSEILQAEEKFSDTEDDSEAVERLKQQISENERLSVEIERKNEFINELEDNMRNSTNVHAKIQNELNDATVQLNASREETEAAIQALASETERCKSLQETSIIESQDYLNEIESLSLKLTQKDDEMAEFELEIKELSDEKLQQISKQMELQNQAQEMQQEIEELQKQLSEREAQKASKSQANEQLQVAQERIVELTFENAQRHQRMEAEIDSAEYKVEKARVANEELLKELDAKELELEQLEATNKQIFNSEESSGYLKIQNQANELLQLQEHLDAENQKIEVYRQQISEERQEILDCVERFEQQKLQLATYESSFAELGRYVESYCPGTCEEFVLKMESRVKALGIALGNAEARILEFADANSGREVEELTAQLQSLTEDKLKMLEREHDLQEELEESHGTQALYQQQLIAAQDQINQMEQQGGNTKRKSAKK